MKGIQVFKWWLHFLWEKAWTNLDVFLLNHKLITFLWSGFVSLTAARISRINNSPNRTHLTTWSRPTELKKQHDPHWAKEQMRKTLFFFLFVFLMVNFCSIYTELCYLCYLCLNKSRTRTEKGRLVRLQGNETEGTERRTLLRPAARLSRSSWKWASWLKGVAPLHSV